LGESWGGELFRAKRNLFLSFALGLGLITLSFLFYNYYSKRPEVLNLGHDQDFHRDLNTILHFWEEGDASRVWMKGEIKCESLLGKPEQTHPEFTRCNPDFLQCLYENKKLSFKLVSLSLQKNKKIYNISSDQKESRVDIEFEARGKKYRAYLKDTCHQVTLPEKGYAYGAYDKKKDDFVFDTKKIPIKLDQFLVTNRDIREWREDLMREPLSHPAGHLSIEEQENFCQFRGKQSLKAQYFDAASFFWQDKEAIIGSSTVRFDYPSNDRSYPLKKFFDGKEEYDLSYCYHLRSAECVGKYPYKSFSTQTATWSGLFDVLGGEFESFYNPLDPKLNLKTSSQHFKINHQFTLLGSRSYWDGKGFNKKNFHWRLLHEHKEESFPVTFRCMQYQDSKPSAPKLGDELFLAHTSYLSSYVNGGEEAREPAGTTQLIAAFQATNHSYYFFYQVPYQKNIGSLFLVKEKTSKLDLKKNFEEKNILWEKEIAPFKVFLKEEDFKHKTHQFLKNQLVFIAEDSEPLVFNLYNLARDHNGALLLSSADIVLENTKMSLKANEVNFCHKLRDDCSDELANTCDLCPGSWYPVIYGQCKKAYSKVCGVERCGGKDEPACPGSFEFAEDNPKGVCFAGSKVGFCQQGLETSCEDNLLLCL
jgi:hypothetical protein